VNKIEDLKKKLAGAEEDKMKLVGRLKDV